MTVLVTGTVVDVTGRKDSREWRAWSPVYREGTSGEVVTYREQDVQVVAGNLTARLEPGPCFVQNPDGDRWLVTVPDHDTELWPLIAVAVSIPPETPADTLTAAVTAYFDANPVEVGPAGPPNVLNIGTVTNGAPAATITGTSPAQTLNLVLPKGDKGDKGDQGIQGVPGEQGIEGPQGVPGVSLDIEGSVATYADLAALTPTNGQAWIVNADGRLYFYDGGFPADGQGVPFRGPQGVQGIQGVQGTQGEQGIQGPVGDTGPQGVQGVKGDTGATGPKGDTGATGPAGSNAWADITGKPSTFPPTIGSGATDAVAGNDSRLTNARTPTAHTHPVTDLTATGRTSSTFLRGDNTWATPPATTTPTQAIVPAGESTSSASYVDLTTTTDTVTMTVPSSGAVMVCLYAQVGGNTAGAQGYMSFAMSGNNTAAASDDTAIMVRYSGSSVAMGWIGSPFVLTGLTPGSTTFKAKYRAAGGTATFTSRRIAVIPL